MTCVSVDTSDDISYISISVDCCSDRIFEEMYGYSVDKFFIVAEKNGLILAFLRQKVLTLPPNFVHMAEDLRN